MTTNLGQYSTDYGYYSDYAESTGCLECRKICGFRRSTFFVCIYVWFYVCFLVFGAMVFVVMEAPVEMKLRLSIKAVRENFLRNHPCLTDAELEAFIVDIVNAQQRGVSAVRNATMEPNWSFGQSLFFSGTVVTTIGYGHVAPLSEGGKLFCIMYALVGIPLTLILLTAFVERLMIPTTYLLHFLNSKLGHLYQPFNIRLFHLSIVVTFVLVVFYLIPAAIFASLEPDWNYMDSLYYCVISLTTIGLGDYVPGDYPEQPYRPLYKICTTLYLLIGVTFMMLMLTIFYDIPQLNFGLFFLLKSDENDPEKMHLRSGSNMTPGMPKYTQQIDDQVIVESRRVKSRQADFSSPEDN